MHYPCRPENDFVPDPREIAALDHAAARARSSSSTRTTRPARCIRAPCSKAIARIAEKHHLVVFSDEIYDQMTYDGAEFVPMATLVQRHAVLHDVRACRRSIAPAAIASAGRRSRASSSGARDYLAALELLRRCGCAATCRGSGPCRRRSAAIRASTSCSRPGGRLYESRQAILDGVAAQPLSCSSCRRAARCTRSSA